MFSQTYIQHITNSYFEIKTLLVMCISHGLEFENSIRTRYLKEKNNTIKFFFKVRDIILFQYGTQTKSTLCKKKNLLKEQIL